MMVKVSKRLTGIITNLRLRRTNTSNFRRRLLNKSLLMFAQAEMVKKPLQTRHLVIDNYLLSTTKCHRQLIVSDASHTHWGVCCRCHFPLSFCNLHHLHFHIARQSKTLPNYKSTDNLINVVADKNTISSLNDKDWNPQINNNPREDQNTSINTNEGAPAPPPPPPPPSPSSIFVFALYPTWEPVHRPLYTVTQSVDTIAWWRPAV